MKQTNESMWEALCTIRDNLDDEQAIFDTGFTVTRHGQEEFTSYIVECPEAFQWSWTIMCDLATGFWIIK
jgi:hypothetical protein